MTFRQYLFFAGLVLASHSALVGQAPSPLIGLQVLTEGYGLGVQLQGERPIYLGKRSAYQLNLGLTETIYFEHSSSETSTDATVMNQLGPTLQQYWLPLRGRRLYLGTSVHAYWSLYHNEARYENVRYGIDRTEEVTNHRLGWGMGLQLGYRLSDRWTVQAMLQVDLSRTIGRYDFALERPSFFLGLGAKWALPTAE